MERIRDSKETIICLMCAEIDPINCHRFILVGRYLGDLTNIITKRNGEVLYESKAETEKRINGNYDKQAAKIEYKV